MGKKKISVALKNPFSQKTNRNKHFVLGQKVRGNCGSPAVSNSLSRARKKTLLNVRKRQKKANKFVDKRLVTGLTTDEEHTSISLVRQRQRNLKNCLFNLNEEENLTHKGLSIDQHQRFEDNVSGSEEENPLDVKFVNQAHFGGFLTEEFPLTHKELVAQLILDSKQKKQERKVERQLNIDLTEKVDAEWKLLHSTFSGVKGRKKAELHEKNDPYDVAVNELKFQLRGVPTDSLKSSEEIIREQEEKLKTLESERRLRMVDSQDANDSRDHISADSIYDGMNLEEINSEDVMQDTDDCEVDSSLSDNENSKICNSVINQKQTRLSTIGVPVKTEFLSLLEAHNADDVHKTVQAILNFNLVTKWEKHRLEAGDFFGILLDHIQTFCEKSVKNIEVVTSLFPHLYTLAELSPNETAYHILRCLDEEQKQFLSYKEGHLQATFPSLMSLVLLKLCSVLYSTSDFYHPVITPASIFASDILASALSASFQNMVLGLFVCKFCLEWVSHSKRIVPEALGFLNKVLCMILQEESSFDVVDDSIQINLLLLGNIETDPEVKKNILPFVVDLLCSYAELYSESPSFYELFAKTRNLCSSFSTNRHPAMFRLIHRLSIRNVSPRTHLIFLQVKPKPLKLFEPYFEYKTSNKEDNDIKKRKLAKRVSQKIRKEEKSLLREIRQDSRLVASDKLQQQMEADNQRKQKVKLLYKDLAVQEGEYKRMNKNK